MSNLENPRVVSRTEWLVARKELLASEKELTRAREPTYSTGAAS